MTDYTVLYNRFRRGPLLGDKGGLDEGEFQGSDSLLKYCELRHLRVADVAYILATVYHETGGTMQPIDELGGTGYFTLHYGIEGNNPARARRNGNVNPGDGPRYHGRGLVQITWRGNYKRIGDFIKVDLENFPDRAKDLPIATQIAVDGMSNGWFTGAKLSRFLPRTGRADRGKFYTSRQIINGTDKADAIAGYALTFQEDLIAAGWTL